jgi:hypothetical protein
MHSVVHGFLVLVTSGYGKEYVAEGNNKSAQGRKVDIFWKEIVYKTETESNITWLFWKSRSLLV